MIVRMRLEITDEERRALRHRGGKKGEATRKEIVHELSEAIDLHVESALISYRHDMGMEGDEEAS